MNLFVGELARNFEVFKEFCYSGTRFSALIEKTGVGDLCLVFDWNGRLLINDV